MKTNILNKRSKQQLKDITIYIDNIINTNISNKTIIEKTFDALLDLTYILGQEVESVYYRLLNYYKSIDLEAANDYETFYLEIINEDEKYTLKKEKNM